MNVGVSVVVPMDIDMGMGMDGIMGMVVVMAVGRGGNHPRTLYYNITPVHGRHSSPARVPLSKKAAAVTTAP